MLINNDEMMQKPIQITIDDYDNYDNKAKIRNVDLVIDLDYYGCLEVDSKYLQKSIIQWLIGQLKYYEIHQHKLSIECEISADNDLFCGYMKNTYLTQTSNDNEYFNNNNIDNEQCFIFKHKLTQIFKLTQLIDDKLCFAYFYRDASTTPSSPYKLYLFKSNKSNLVQVIMQLQHKALKFKQIANNSLITKSFCVEFIGETTVTKTELSLPNLIEICLKRINEMTNESLQQPQEKLTRKYLLKHFNLNLQQQQQQQIQPLAKKVLLNFTKKKIILEEIRRNSKHNNNENLNSTGKLTIIEENYDNLIYFNNSFKDEKFFCLAYNSNNCIRAVVFQTSNYETIMKEYIKNISKLNDDRYFYKNEEQSSQIIKRSCIECPMQQYIELCEYLNCIQSEYKIYVYLLKKFEKNLDKLDQDLVSELLYEENININSYNTYYGRNRLLMGLLHKLCKLKQMEHFCSDSNFTFKLFTHDVIGDSCDNDESGLVNSFIIKLQSKKREKLSVDNIHSNHRLLPLPRRQRGTPLTKRRVYKKSKTVDLFDVDDHMILLNNTDHNEDDDKKLSSLSKSLSTLLPCLSPNIRQHNKQQLLTTSISNCSLNSTQRLYKRRESMRRTIFNKVFGGSSNENETNETLQPLTDQQQHNKQRRRSSQSILTSILLDVNLPVVQPEEKVFKRFKTSQDIRQFWKKVISEQIILIKMDQENKKIKQKAKMENIPKRRKRANMAFCYDEIELNKKDLNDTWDRYLSNSETLVDYEQLRKCVIDGVAQSQRDVIWLWLAKQYSMRNKQLIEKSNRNCGIRVDVDYNDLLKESTTHQHAIMLDLSRTFPTHPNFSQQFGPGQLALFNILKAYSILDPEVGYCQGLSFIVGILLIHCDNDEEKAFELLKHLLITMGLRKQFKPDMFALQKYMYQMTRLLYDYHNDIYQHLEDNETSATLYCAPWFLTLFASQFEIGFVARVFDFLFLDGQMVLFKIALAIMSVHKALLMHCESFEVIVNYLKITVPEMSLIQSELIINKANEFNDIKHDLDSYEIEFYIFHEELQLNSQNDTNEKQLQLPSSITLSPLKASDMSTSLSFKQLEQINCKLKERIEDLLEQIQLHQVTKHNQDDLIYKLEHENLQLKCKIDTLEIERIGLLNQLKKMD